MEVTLIPRVTLSLARIALTSSGIKKMLRVTQWLVNTKLTNLLLNKLHTTWHQNIALTEQTLISYVMTIYRPFIGSGDVLAELIYTFEYL